MSDKENKVETWASWVAKYTPYKSEIRRVGFDEMLANIADHLYDPEHDLAKKWGDFGISGQHDLFIEIEVFEGEDTVDRTTLELQDDLSAFLGSEGYQGGITVHRAVNLTNKIELDKDGA